MQHYCVTPACGARLLRGDIARAMRLCKGCRERVSGHLSGLPGLYVACEQFLELRPSQPVRLLRSRPLTGIRISEPVLRLREMMIGALSSWCGMVVEERGVAGPGSVKIERLTSYLLAHLDWLAAHPAAADFVAEVCELVATARQVLDPEPGWSIDLGRCVEDGCRETVRARFGTANGSPARQVTCDAGHIWPPSRWLQLRHRLSRRAGSGHHLTDVQRDSP
jgi:hypothetical protein